ncbi:hypothetical protein AB9E26_36495, partial [Rhizobium leguminosarum]
VDAFGTITVSLVLAWVTALPAYFIVVFYRAARPNGPLRLPAGSRVAMVVTKAPAEPFSVVGKPGVVFHLLGKHCQQGLADD